MSILLPLENHSKLFAVKQKQFNQAPCIVKISGAISQAIQDENISHGEFFKILQEMEKSARRRRDSKTKENNRLQKHSEKNFLNKEEKKTRNIFL